MTRISVSLDEQVAGALKVAAGGDGQVSRWVAAAIREKLLTAAAAAAGEFDRAVEDAADDGSWEANRLTGRA